MIDEVLHILDSLANSYHKDPSGLFKVSDRPLRTHEVLQELRDISSMAIDHFDENISPSLKSALNERPLLPFFNCTSLQTHCMCWISYTIFQFPKWNPNIILCLSHLFHSLCVVSPDTLSLSLPAFYSPLQHSGMASTSTPQMRSEPRLIDPYKNAYIRMQRKFQITMQKVCQLNYMGE